MRSTTEAQPLQLNHPHRFSRGFPHKFPHKGVLPEGHYYTLTWGISYDFGGMTTVALERSSAFARQDNRQVEILTLSAELKDQDRERELRAEGRIDRRVHLRNIWKDLTSWSDRKLRRMIGTSDVDPTAADDVLARTGSEWTETRRDSDENDLQVDRYHDNGALVLSDRLDMNKRGKRGGRTSSRNGRLLAPSTRHGLMWSSGLNRRT